MSTESLERRVYNAYRQALSGQRTPRAAARRQRAREIVVNRYHVSFAQVKDIVTRFDHEAGVTHEHTTEYLRWLEIKEAQDVFDSAPHPCQCGSTEMVRVRPDPYAAEIEGRYRLTTLCFRCYLVLEADI